MKKRLLLILSLLLPTLLMANPIDQNEAKEKALSFINARSIAKTRGPQTAGKLHLVTSNESFHIFNVGNNEGFVIVSGDDCAQEILGYSDSGNINPTDMPENMRSWLQGYADEISWMKQKGITASKANASTRGAIKANINPLIKTKWDQGAPYNNLCPEYATGKKCATGCVATAMAQVMYYHQWPTAATAAIPEYDSQSALAATTFDWANMQLTYSSGSQDPNDAVATLMLYCGHSVQMNYGPSSGANTANVADALKTYFGYNATTNYLDRSYYSYGDWINLLYNELSQKRPIVYSGQSSGGGHAFVVNGYEYEDFFYVNWGWGGSSDGFFKLSALDPAAQGIGGSSSKDGFNFGQGAIVGIQKPSDDGTVLNITPITVNLQLISITADNNNPAVGEPVQITISVKNNSTDAYDGDIWIADNSSLLLGKTIQIPSKQTKDCVLSFVPEAEGTYNIQAFYPGGNGYYYQLGTQSVTIEASGSGGGGGVSSDINLTRTVNVENCTSNIFYGSGSQNTFKATVTVTNPSLFDNYSGIYQIDLYDKEGNSLVGRTISSVTIPAENNVILNIEANGLTNGKTYILATIYQKGEGSSDWETAEYTAKAGIVSYNADGTKTAKAPTKSYKVPDSSVAVELTGTGVTSITKNSNPNCIYILGSSDAVPSELTNVVKYNGSTYTASSIALTDGKDFYSPVDFTANEIEFTYKFTTGADGTNGWNTIMLPFNVSKVTADGTAIDWFHSSSDTGKKFWVKEFTDDDPGTVNFGFTNSMKANTPYIVAFPGNHWGSAWDLSGKTIKFVGENVNVSNSEAATTVTGSNYRFVGSTHSVNTTNIYCLNDAGNKFNLKTSGGSTAFRAFFKPGIYDSSATSLSIGGDDNTTGIERIVDNEQQESGTIYNLNGQRVEKPSKGLYIVNGKKVIIK